MAEDIDTISFACLSLIVLKFGLHRSILSSPNFATKWPPVDLRVGDIQRWRAYRKSPSLFRMVPSLTSPYDLSFPQNGLPNAEPTSRRVLPPAKYDRRYREDFFCIRAMSSFVKLL